MAHTAIPVIVDTGAAPPAAVAAPLVLEHPHTSTGLDSRKLLMWAFLASDCMFFGTLIATYLVYKNRSPEGPLPRETFDVPYTSVSAFVLLLSSLTMVLALAAIQRGEERRMRVWLSATALLGCVFLGGQFYEFTTFYREGLTLSRNLFGSRRTVLLVRPRSVVQLMTISFGPVSLAQSATARPPWAAGSDFTSRCTRSASSTR